MIRRERHCSLDKCPYRRLAERIEELGGIWHMVGGDQNMYSMIYLALTKYQNPRKNTIDILLELTGLSYEEAFQVDEERESNANCEEAC